MVYSAECLLCKQQVDKGDRPKNNVGIYIGETGRCLAERSKEHLALLMAGSSESFILKHWAEQHIDTPAPPEIRFKVVKNHRDCITRLLHEAILIESEGSMNSKTEWRLNVRPKLVVELSDFEKDKQASLQSEQNEKLSEKLSVVRRKLNLFNPRGTWLNHMTKKSKSPPKNDVFVLNNPKSPKMSACATEDVSAQHKIYRTGPVKRGN